MRLNLRRLIQTLVALCFGVTSACGQATLNDLWEGRARFEQVGELKYGAQWSNGVPKEIAGWYAVANGRWYAFSRSVITARPAYCPHDSVEVLVSESRDKGRTWSNPVTAVSPGASAAGDGHARRRDRRGGVIAADPLRLRTRDDIAPACRVRGPNQQLPP